ncbi:hypothetical protein DPMN_076786 [Dreissena polymorpha]|uniref:Uncharacterized protein n=1 Tax=Dreissena polymorpha TaxID=45954 RepID=A0A9D4BG22_DREPO|nr:hypothetical protein DPMN_076786 [Dreissena polymorpha]
MFHGDRTINVASRVLTMNNVPPPGEHVFKPTLTIVKFVQDITRMNLLTKFHNDRTINVASRVLTRFYYGHIMKNAPPPGGHVFKPTDIIFGLIQDIIRTKLLTKFHEDRTINVSSRPYKEKCHVLVSHVFPANVNIFKLIQIIIETNFLTKFHDDWTINVASRVLTRKNAPPPWRLYIIGTNLLNKFHEDLTITVACRVLTRKNSPPPGGVVFKATGTIL